MAKNRSVNWTNVNFPRGGDKKQCQIPTWGVGTPGGGGGVGHEIDKCIIIINKYCTWHNSCYFIILSCRLPSSFLQHCLYQVRIEKTVTCLAYIITPNIT